MHRRNRPLYSRPPFADDRNELDPAVRMSAMNDKPKLDPCDRRCHRASQVGLDAMRLQARQAAATRSKALAAVVFAILVMKWLWGHPGLTRHRNVLRPERRTFVIEQDPIGLQVVFQQVSSRQKRFLQGGRLLEEGQAGLQVGPGRFPGEESADPDSPRCTDAHRFPAHCI